MSEDVQLYNSKYQESIEKFQMMLNQYPDKSEVLTNAQARNAKYLPIAVIERLLDENFSGLWQTNNFRWEVIANEVVGSIDLQVFHPTAKVWLTRTGAASAMIQIEKDMPLTVGHKIKNTLVKDFPHLKTECLKNAAKSLGVRFGRSLNRGELEDYTYLSENVGTLSEIGERAWALLNTAKVSDAERAKIEKRINRSTGKALEDLVTWLEGRQS